MLLRSIDPYDLFADYFDFEGFLALATKYKLPAAKIWLRCCRENALDNTYAPPYKKVANGRWDLSTWDISFAVRFAERMRRLIAAGVTPMLVYVDGATWTQKTWAKHPWNKANNTQEWGTTDFGLSREAGPSGNSHDDCFMELFWYPLVDEARKVLLPEHWDKIIHVPTSEPRQTFHPTRFMVRHLRSKHKVPRERIMLTGLNDRTAEWDGLKASDDLKKNVGIVSVHGCRDAKLAQEKLGDFPQRYPHIHWRPDSDGARVPGTNDYLSRAGLDGRLTGMKPAWWKGVLQEYPTAGLLLGLWGQGHPNISKLKPNEWPKYWTAAEPLFRVVGGK